MPFSSLQWTYGGFDGKNAQLDAVRLSGLRSDGNNVWYKFDTDLTVWGMPHTEAGGAIFAVFIERSPGVWTGGKFDWVSSSRTHRELKHLTNYNGWHESLPIRGRVACVIVSANRARRSNVVVAEAK